MDTLDSYLVEIRKLLRATDQSRGKGKAVSASTQEHAGGKTERKGRGRMIRTDSLGGIDDMESGDDDGMGGYGFFDAGMLLHALKGTSTGEREDGKTSPRRLVGKSLKFNEY
ncbi:hypothetical protein FQN49_007947 [Arthroderma sp. PD_2]|nr:hypothetical protein FQN49_007947 [Arthroderma sp. PD_2]